MNSCRSDARSDHDSFVLLTNHGAFRSMVVTAPETGPHAFGPFCCVPHDTSRMKDPVACWGNSPASTPTGQCQALQSPSGRRKDNASAAGNTNYRK